MKTSKLERISIRDVWPKDEKDFSPWLEKNIELLGDTLGLTLTTTGKEVKVGKAFRADLLAEGPDSELVVIENQFGKSDHDHLGKIITYLTNLEAKRAVWICEKPQKEHIAAVEWFNKHSPQDMGFYLVKLEVFKIDNSYPAPKFSIASEPSEMIKDASGVRDDLAKRHVERLKFWEKLLEISNMKTSLFRNRSPNKENWISAGSGISKIVYQYIICMGDGRIQLTMENPDRDKNKQAFDVLFKNKELIENTFGESLNWDRLNDFKSSKIWKKVSSKGLRDSESWQKTIEKMTNSMIRFQKAFGNHIDRLNI